MSNYASDDAFTFKRQFKTITVPGKGDLIIQSLSGAEAGPIQTAQQRFTMLSLSKDGDKASRAANQVAVETIVAGVVDENHQQRWKGADGKKFVAGWGAADQEYVAAEINKFNDLDALNLEDSAKNFDGTSTEDSL